MLLRADMSRYPKRVNGVVPIRKEPTGVPQTANMALTPQKGSASNPRPVVT